MDIKKKRWVIVFGKIFISISRSILNLKRKLWRLKFLLETAGTLSKVELGIGQRFDVPVSVGGGLGKLVVCDGVGFGWRSAPMLGNGSILLEPRSVGSEIHIGSRTMFSNNVSIISVQRIIIGKNCLIGDATSGDATSIMDSDFHSIDPACRNTGEVRVAPIVIGDNVWIGSRVLILRGVNIGKNSVIGAGSIVTKNIPENTLAVGVPAEIIRTI